MKTCQQTAEVQDKIQKYLLLFTIQAKIELKTHHTLTMRGNRTMNYNYEEQKIYLTDFLNSLSLERNLSGKTIYAYKSDLSCMFSWLNENKYKLINPQSISDYFLYLQNNKKLSPRSIRRKYV